MTTLTLLIQSGARVQGCGGAGAQGGGSDTGGPGLDGGDGGPAFQADHAISIDNQGQLWAGGAGGGGGGVGQNVGQYWPGGGGGPGAGTSVGIVGPKGFFNIPPAAYTDAQPGSAATRDVAGNGGKGSIDSTGNWWGGDGGNGGGPGLAGSAGTFGYRGSTWTGGAAGQPGAYIVGNALVTWTNLGDVRGLVVA